jgi:hypothetical protein
MSFLYPLFTYNPYFIWKHRTAIGQLQSLEKKGRFYSRKSWKTIRRKYVDHREYCTFNGTSKTQYVSFYCWSFYCFSGGNRATLYAFEKTGRRTKAEANRLDPEL